MTETQVRSLIKTMSWRIIASLTTILLVFIFTGDLAISFGVSFLEIITKLIAYYIHERVWIHITWGTLSTP